VFRRIRIAILLVILVGVCGWAVYDRVFLPLRPSWEKPVVVGVAVLRHGNVSPEMIERLEAGLEHAERWLADEYHRHTNRTTRPCVFRMIGVADVSHPVMFPRANEGVWQRVATGLKIRRYVSVIDAYLGDRVRDTDARIYVIARASMDISQERFVEGLSAKGQRYGFVEVTLDPVMINQALIAIVHETLHTVGANDKYDMQGHASVPDGLVEPDLAPRFPQRFAEIMVGEVPLSASHGRLPRGFRELRVGYKTAWEVGWTAR
jgi:hypothetical protein